MSKYVDIKVTILMITDTSLKISDSNGTETWFSLKDINNSIKGFKVNKKEIIQIPKWLAEMKNLKET